MLLKKLSLATLACLFASGCIITDADDDGGSDTEVTTSPTTETPTTETPTTETTGTPTTGDTDPTTDGTTGEPGEGGCGWGPIPGNEEVPNGYQCGIDGTEDPDGGFPIDCSPNAILELGTNCIDAGVTAEGCCDANGDVWFCVDPDGDGPMEPQVGGDDCGDPTGTDTDATDTDTDSGVDTNATATDGDTDTDTDATDTDATDTDAGTTTGK